MATYANYITNPSFEVNTTGWTAEGSSSLSRITTSPTSGTGVMKMSKNATQNTFHGAATIATITPAASQSYTLSLTIKNATEDTNGNTNNAGITVTVYDLLPGQSMGSRQQRATNTFSRTTSGRVAIRNFTPRSTADRIVVVVTTASTFYQAGSTTTTYGSYQYYSDNPAVNSPYQPVSVAQYDNMLSSPNWDGYTESTVGSRRYGKFRTVTTTTTSTINGGTSTVQIDAVQLEQGTTETTYKDGTVTGYAWAGTAHASATLAMLQAETSATASSTGTARLHLLIPIKADATAHSTGTLEAYLIGVGAAAFAGSTGSVELWQYGPLSAAGTISHSESIELAALIPIEASGTASSTGTLTAFLTLPSGADAYAISLGTLDIGLPPDMEAHGTASSVGTVQLAIAGVMAAHAFAKSVGTMDLGQFVPAGSFGDFAIFGVTENDPLMTITASSNGGTNTGATGADWVRIYGSFVAPQEVFSGTTKLWSRAAFVVPGIRFNSLPAGSWQEFTRVQLEVSSSAGTPTTYMDGGSVRPLIYPDRLNLAPDVIAIYEPTTGDFAVADEVTSPILDDTAPALLVEIAAGVNYDITTVLDRLKPLATYTVALYVKPSSGMTDVGFTVEDAKTGASLSPQTMYVDGIDAGFSGGGWRRISTVFKAPVTGVAVMNYVWNITQPQVGTKSFTVAGFLVEEGIGLGNYFFNPENDPEIRYHDGSTNPADGVFQYSDYERKTYILGEALQDYVPEGIGIGELEFSKIPHYDS